MADDQASDRDPWALMQFPFELSFLEARGIGAGTGKDEPHDGRVHMCSTFVKSPRHEFPQKRKVPSSKR